MVGKILCFFGYHDYKHSTSTSGAEHIYKNITCFVCSRCGHRLDIPE